MDERLPKVRESIYTKYIKRSLDIILSGMALIVLSPVLAVTALLELCFMGRPILYGQERIGANEERFTIHKFRSMTNECGADGEFLPDKDRLTGFGRFIRRFSIDELPELWSIFIGKMSIIGPRPLLPEYLPYYSERHRLRHAVRPGLACCPLVTPKTWTWNDQFENDVWYIENCSFAVDFKMLFIIAKVALVGSETRTNSSRESFCTYNPAFQSTHTGERVTSI